jgi:uncharacterized protein YndB with AHSA1/START domain
VIQAEGTVPLDPKAAFALFVDGMNSWWPAEIHTLAVETCTITVEPRIGGRWFERAPTGEEVDWGRVLVYEPDSRLVLSWQLLPDPGFDPEVDDHPLPSFDPDLITEFEATFTAAEHGGTHVALEHRKLENLGTTAGADLYRQYLSEGDLSWTATLENYRQAANSSA